MRRTTLYVYNESDYKRMQAIAKLQGKSVLKFIWDELSDSIRDKYPVGSLEKFFNDSKLSHLIPPPVTDDKKAQLSKFRNMSLEELTTYDDLLDKHYTIFKKIYRGKRDD